MSKPKRFIDLWLVQLGCKHEKCCPQWQKPSYIMKRHKGRADSKENAEMVSFSSHSSECTHCEFSNCVCALCNVCPLAPLTHAVAMCSLSRSGVTRKHVNKSHADPQIQAGANKQGKGIRVGIKGNDKENMLKVVILPLV